MIEWSGRGFTIVIVLLGMIFLTHLVIPLEYSDYASALSLFVTGIYSRIKGKKWNDEKNNRVFIDEKTGERLMVKSNHSLFWIKMQHWGIIFNILGILMIFRGSVTIGIIATIAIILISIFLHINKKKQTKKLNTKNIRNKESEESEEKESEEKKLKRRQEKEDPNRFMPK